MTTPLTTPIAVPATGMSVSAAARTVAAKAPAQFVELSGADLKALLNFQKALPSSKGRKLLNGDEEEFATGKGTMTDSPEWVMAQAGEGVVNVVVDGAAGGAGGAAGGAAGAGAAGAAGAAAAVPVISPLAFAPLAFVNPGSSENNRPTLSRDPVKLTLEVNAPNNQQTSDPQWRAADPDSNTVYYFFQLEEGVQINDPQLFNLDGQKFNLDGKRLSAVSADGNFKIDPVTGQISRIASNDQDEPVLFCEDEAALQVVVTDTALVSLPVEVVIDRTLPGFEGYDSNYAVFDLLYEENQSSDLVVNVEKQDSGTATELYITIDENATLGYKRADNEIDLIRQIDKLSLDFTKNAHITDTAASIESDEERANYLASFKNITGLDFSRSVVPGVEDAPDTLGHDLNAEIYFYNANPTIEAEITIVDQFAGVDTKVEYVEFAEGMTYKGYELHVANELATPGAPDEGGVYHLTTAVDVDGNLVATHCNDLLADADEDIEGATGDKLDGKEGNDLIFSHGSGDTLIGGAGNDLLVIDGEATIVLSASLDNGTDTIVGFGEDSVVDLGRVVNYLDADEINAILTEGCSDEAIWDSFITALTAADVVEFDDTVSGYLGSVYTDQVFALEFFAALEGAIVIDYEESGAHMLLLNGVGMAQQPIEFAHFADVTNFTADNFITQAVLPG
ncbi:hypothetical protein [Limnohabitans sp.]